MSALARLEDRIEKLEAAAEDIREATREAHSATKELRRAEKAVRDLLGADARQLVDAAITERVDEALTAFVDQTTEARNRGVDRIIAEFEKLTDIYLNGTGGDRESLLLAAHDARERRKADLRALTAEITGRPL